MAVNYLTVGPGLFTLGVAPNDFSCQVAKLEVEATENIETQDAVPMLCGDDLPATEIVSLRWKLAGTLQQDIAASGINTYTWANPGPQPFNYQPNLAVDRAITGETRVVPLKVGGDVKTRPGSDFEWAILGTPDLGDVL